LFGISGTAPVIAGYTCFVFLQIWLSEHLFLFLYFNAISGLFGHLAVGHINFILIILLGGSAAIWGFDRSPFIEEDKNNVFRKRVQNTFYNLTFLMD